MAALLSVNVNKIALLRNSRNTNSPNLIEYVQQCIQYGAQGITVHPRPDQRHIRPDDVIGIANLVKHINPHRAQPIEFNIEGNPFAPAKKGDRSKGQNVDYPGFISLVKQASSLGIVHQCTLVPDGDNQLTSDHGFDLTKQSQQLKPVIDELKQMGCRVSLFMDPVPEQIKLAKAIGADRIELYTGPYAEAQKAGGYLFTETLSRYQYAAEYAADIGIGLNAGHDLDLHNLSEFAQIPNLLEVSIGHELTLDALHYGLKTTIEKYLYCLQPQSNATD